MKFIILAVCIFVVDNANAIADTKAETEFKHTVIHMLMDCKGTVGASDDDVNKYSHHTAPNTTAGKCMISCMNKKFKIQDENGKITREAVLAADEKLLKSVNHDLYDIILNNNEKCVNEAIGGLNECDIAARWFTCLSKAQDAVGFTKDLSDE